VVGILSANCYSCHGGAASGSGGVKLDSYNAVLPYIKNGQLLNNIKHAPGADPMPKNAPKLDDCSINTIAAWINNGFTNN
jgi:mono/diheme cytochrome c family protein